MRQNYVEYSMWLFKNFRNSTKNYLPEISVIVFVKVYDSVGGWIFGKNCTWNCIFVKY